MRTYDYAMEELRHMVQNFNNVREGFNSEFTLDQLVQIHRMWMASGWDFYPDQWTERQVEEALKGTPPKWDDDEQPIY